MKPLRDIVRPTTFLEPEKLRAALGIELTLATETFQFTGSFKFRCAYNTASNVPNDEILTASSGNFGQALAFACRMLGKKCTVVMPANTARVKVDAVRSFGAAVDLVDTKIKGRNERLEELALEMPNAYKASAYDDPLVIEGNATLGDEISKRQFDAVVVPVGGGGLISGISTGLCRNGHMAELFGAEPALANDAARSFREGRLIVNEKEPQTIAEGARTISLGKHTWEIIRKGVKDIFEVPEEDIKEAVRLLFEKANLKAEPTGALTLGAILKQRERFEGKKVCLVVSGGNVDMSVYADILTESV